MKPVISRKSRTLNAGPFLFMWGPRHLSLCVGKWVVTLALPYSYEDALRVSHFSGTVLLFTKLYFGPLEIEHRRSG